MKIECTLSIITVKERWKQHYTQSVVSITVKRDKKRQKKKENNQKHTFLIITVKRNENNTVHPVSY